MNLKEIESHWHRITASGDKFMPRIKKSGPLRERLVSAAASGASLAAPLVLRDFVREHSHDSFRHMIESASGSELVSTLMDMAGFVGGEAIAGEVFTQAVLAWQLNRFEFAGRRVYAAGDGLSRKLLVTRMTGLKCSDVRLPYDCIYVVVDRALGFGVYNQDTGWHDLVGVYLTEDESGIRVLMTGHDKGGRRVMGVEAFNDAMNHFHIDLGDGDRSFDGVMDGLEKRMSDHDDAWHRQSGSGGVESGDLVSAWRRSMTWVMALVFYVCHSQPASEHVIVDDAVRALYARARKARSDNKARKLRARARALNSESVIYIDRGAPVDKDMPRNCREAESAEASGRGTKRVLVAGHWQRFAVGPGRVDRVWKFREPFFRGSGIQDGDDDGGRIHVAR